MTNMLKKLWAKIIKKEICPQCKSLRTHAHYGDSEHCEWEYSGHTCSKCLHRWDCMMIEVDHWVKIKDRSLKDWVNGK